MDIDTIIAICRKMTLQEIAAFHGIISKVILEKRREQERRNLYELGTGVKVRLHTGGKRLPKGTEGVIARVLRKNAEVHIGGTRWTIPLSMLEKVDS